MVGRGKRRDVTGSISAGQLSFDALLWGPAADTGEEGEGDERDQHQPAAAEPVRADGAHSTGRRGGRTS